MNCTRCGYPLTEGARFCSSCGQLQTGPPAPAEERGWFRRNIKWVVPLGCLGLVALAAGFVALVLSLFFGFFGIFRNSDVYQEALMRVRANPQVEAALGTPIEAGWLMRGNLQISNDSGNADMDIPISGPKGKGTISLEARKDAGVWTFQKLIVLLEDGSEIDLLTNNWRAA